MVLWSRQPRLEGHCYALEPSAGGITVGRSEQSDIVLDDGSVSRCHARFERRVDGWWVVDQGSVNGTLVDGAQVRARRLRYGDRVQVGSTIFKVVHEHDDGRIVENVYSSTPIDGLTQLYNRRHLLEQIDRELGCPGRRLALVLLDVDRFKLVNDVHGHLAGDAVLRGIASLMQRHAQPDGVLARYGGDEFVVLLAGASAQEAAARARALRSAIAAHEFAVEGRVIAVTMSVGVAEASEETRSASDLVRSAQQDLHTARLAAGP